MSSGLWVRQPIVEMNHWRQEKRSGAGIRRKVKEISVSEVSLEKGNACVLVCGYAGCQGAEFSRNSSGQVTAWLGAAVKVPGKRTLRGTITPFLLIWTSCRFDAGKERARFRGAGLRCQGHARWPGIQP